MQISSTKLLIFFTCFYRNTVKVGYTAHRYKAHRCKAHLQKVNFLVISIEKISSKLKSYVEMLNPRTESTTIHCIDINNLRA